MQPFSITLFATTGDPEGIRHLDKSNWSGYGVVFNRELFHLLKQEPGFSQAGIRAAPTRRRKAVFLRHSQSRSRPLEQAKKQTDGPQTSVNPRLRALNAQEGNREQREKNGGMRAWNGDFRRAVLKRQEAETAPTQGERAKKIPTG